jgi:hypothetical protein
MVEPEPVIFKLSPVTEEVAKVKEGPLIRTLEVMVVVAPKAAVLVTQAQPDVAVEEAARICPFAQVAVTW